MLMLQLIWLPRVPPLLLLLLLMLRRLLLLFLLLKEEVAVCKNAQYLCPHDHQSIHAGPYNNMRAMTGASMLARQQNRTVVAPRVKGEIFYAGAETAGGLWAGWRY